MGSLQSHKHRINRLHDDEEKTFEVSETNFQLASRGRGRRGVFRGR